MSLYSRKRAHESPVHSSTEDDNDVISISDDENIDEFFASKKPGKGQRGRPPVRTNSKTSTTSVTSAKTEKEKEKEKGADHGRNTRKRAKVEEKENSKAKDTGKACFTIDLVDDDDDDEQDLRVAEEIKRLKQLNGGSGSSSATEELPSSEIIDLDLDVECVPDKITESLLKLKKTITNTKLKKNTVRVENDLMSEAPLVRGSSIYIPEVRTAQQRAEEAKALLAQKAQSSSSSSSSSRVRALQEEEEEDDDGGEKMRFKTRLGNDDRPWSISSSAPLNNLKKKLSKLYNVPVDKISLFFDGEKIGDQDTAESRDMEEDDLIDVKMDRALIQPAIEHAKSKGQ